MNLEENKKAFFEKGALLELYCNTYADIAMYNDMSKLDNLSNPISVPKHQEHTQPQIEKRIGKLQEVSAAHLSAEQSAVLMYLYMLINTEASLDVYQNFFDAAKESIQKDADLDPVFETFEEAIPELPSRVEMFFCEQALQGGFTTEQVELVIQFTAGKDTLALS